MTERIVAGLVRPGVEMTAPCSVRPLMGESNVER